MKTSTVAPRGRASRASPRGSTSSQKSRVTKRSSAQSSPMKEQRRRKPTTQRALAPDAMAVNPTNDAPGNAKRPQAQSYQIDGISNERRARRWRNHPPQSYLERLERIRRTKFAYHSTRPLVVFVS
ncbi:hypothetical protein N7523_009331 [Penicillium sp. IBT 18751x]|nr:hypothetical protein N7523_009331 [Penicillium sp. IBT 18751x]